MREMLLITGGELPPEPLPLELPPPELELLELEPELLLELELELEPELELELELEPELLLELEPELLLEPEPALVSPELPPQALKVTVSNAKMHCWNNKVPLADFSMGRFSRAGVECFGLAFILMLHQTPPLWNLVHLSKMFCEFTRACKEFERVKTWREKHSVGSHSLGCGWHCLPFHRPVCAG